MIKALREADSLDNLERRSLWERAKLTMLDISPMGRPKRHLCRALGRHCRFVALQMLARTIATRPPSVLPVTGEFDVPSHLRRTFLTGVK
jgi:hypothetical protein